MTTISISVRYTGGAYQTSALNKQRASSTMSDQAAADRLGGKVFGPAFIRSSLTERVDAALGRWLIEGDDKAYAWAWASGLIDIHDAMPSKRHEGAIAFASGPRRALEERLGVLARHGQGASEGELLVPGVPEAENDDAGLEALMAFTKWAGKANERPDVYGVVFGRSDVL
ncbi:hypothetical protein BH10PSE18_BH10PSE18_18760 [soil metagenome]